MPTIDRQSFDDDKIRVMQATDIVRLISQHVTLKKAGREYKGICPFHDDHNPSMSVSPQKQIYKCWPCGAGGDAISFVMAYHKMSFREALEYLADRAGIKLTPRRVSREEHDDDQPSVSREALAGANKAALDFYRAILAHAEHGKAAREVLARRGVSAEMIERFQVGAAPDRWDGLALTIASKNLDAAPFLAAGLIKNRQNGEGAFDMQRNRVIFPIFDQLGRPIAFGGRRINDQDEPKYINSSESAIFNKSATLYALNLAADEIRKSRQAIVVEGYMDVIACHQAGVTNVVATLGTALASAGARTLARLCDRVVLLFDGDDAGQRAADRAIEVFFGSTLDVRIATLAGARAAGLTQAKDPDELVKQPGGADVLRTCIADATDALEYRFARMKQRLAPMTDTQRANAINDELQRLADLGLSDLHPVRKQMVIKRVGQLAGMGEEHIRRALAEIRPSRSMRAADAQSAAAAPNAAPAAPPSLADHALELAVAEPSLWVGMSAADRALLEPAAFAGDAAREVARTLAALPAGADARAAQWALRSLNGEPASLIAGMHARAGKVYGDDPAAITAAFSEIIERLRRKHMESHARSTTDLASALKILQAAKGRAAAASQTPASNRPPSS